jgi:hypothetical protein
MSLAVLLFGARARLAAALLICASACAQTPDAGDFESEENPGDSDEEEADEADASKRDAGPARDASARDAGSGPSTARRDAGSTPSPSARDAGSTPTTRDAGNASSAGGLDVLVDGINGIVGVFLPTNDGGARDAGKRDAN